MGKDSKLKKILIRFIILMVILIIICVGIVVVRENFRVTQIDVLGNKHYSVDEIKDIVLDGPYGNNSIYLYLKYNKKSIDDIPFIEKMDVTIKSPTHIRIDVYEKAMAGYIEYLGHYIYFDREGIAVESSLSKVEGVPFVTGLEFEHVVLHEKLPVENDRVFEMILNITQLLTKYEITTDRIYFDNNENVTLYFGDARVYIGSQDYIDEKINELRLLLPQLQEKGYSGVLHMENYRGEGGSFTFNKDEDKNEMTFEFEDEEAEVVDENTEVTEE